MNKFKNLKILIRKNKFINNKKINKYQILLSIFLLLLFLFVFIFRFFHNGWEWISSDYDKIFYKENVLNNISYFLVGFSMPVIGCCMQIVTNNSLAEPTTLGFYPIIFMASLISQFFVNTDLFSYMFAILFSLLIIVINFLIVKGNPIHNTFKSILVGFCINAVTTGINYLIITYSSANTNPLSWLTGNIGIISQNRLIISSVINVVFLIILFSLINYLDVIQKNYSIAKMLGIKVNLIYWIVVISVMMIAITNILLVGGVILLGIVVPHLVRLIFKPNNVLQLLIFSAIMGSTLLSYSAWIVDMLNSLLGKSLNINIFTSVLSIFIFISLFKKHKK